jgi:hypothetical protein
MSKNRFLKAMEGDTWINVSSQPLRDEPTLLGQREEIL